jgi:hypothetical protein
MSNIKQTAVEYFFNKMIEYLQNAESEGVYSVGTQNTKRWLEIFLDDAKTIEKERMNELLSWITNNVEKLEDQKPSFALAVEQYYTETYGE